MQNCRNDWPELRGRIRRAALLAALACSIGCAAPGPPLPPTLNLPQVVAPAGFTASRVGGDVKLHWTTAKQTTDKLPVKGAITAAICRSLVESAAQSQQNACVPAVRITVSPGETDAVDTLPDGLAEGPARLLSYRVQLLNSAGRTAGPSSPVYAAAGAAPPPLTDFAGEPTAAGVELRWRRQTVPGAIELDRRLLDPPPAAAVPEPKAGLPAMQRQPAEMRLRAGDPGAPDAGGTLDRMVEMGHRYAYTAQRVTSAIVLGQELELRSTPTPTLEFAVHDVFPPATPQGLVAAPGFLNARPAIDLSWEPVLDEDIKPKLAGYKVYRSDAAGSVWKSLGTVAEPSYRDATVTPGSTYRYHVTALSTAGNESSPSSPAAETAPPVR